MKLRRWGVLIGVALLVIALDQLTKALVVANLGLYEQWAPIEALRPYFTFTYVQNTGAAFGLFQGGRVVFLLVGVVVIGIILVFYRQLPEGATLMRVALGMQLGGVLGNQIDRVRLGYVVDFFDFKFWPVFNVADSALVVGVISLLVLMWWYERTEARQQPTESASGETPAAAGEDETSPLRPG
ncbi:MAG: signal peptidase II [Anaerolineae bacterium]